MGGIPFNPTKIWCGMRCIRDKQTCVFENCCPYRKRVMHKIVLQVRNSARRQLKNGGGYMCEPTSELISLFRVYLMTGFKCYYCGQEMMVDGEKFGNNFSLEHRIPLSKGGKNTIDNFAYFCEKCNHELGMNLQKSQIPASQSEPIQTGWIAYVSKTNW